ncbi:MAG: FAD-binding protein [Alphaproteobacteria bacterium]|nr:MAG: FAD-binding protein [Alphaproteobacteria bacterium]
MTQIINDVTALNPVEVWAVTRPETADDVADAVARATGPISIGGGRFSMGGQTASPGSLHIDMRGMNRVLAFAPTDKVIRVQAGIRWCDIQRFIDPHGLSVKIMQTYANFTVGGSLSVNVHGRYMGLGPLILSVRAIRIVLASGELVDATPTENADIFYGAIGGYGGLGILVEAELDLVDNVRVERRSRKMKTSEYLAYFKENVRNSGTAVFHNADLYPPHYNRLRAVTWSETDRAATTATPLMPTHKSHWLHKYFFWAVTETLKGKWRREYLVDPVLFAGRPVHWRNYEAGYDVAELEPASRMRSTYVLQEYFVPIDRFDAFVPKMAEILKRHRVNMVNISVRHAKADPGAYMAWAREEVFAFVLYYKQRTRENACKRVGVWTRELVDAALSEGGTYYLPYQAHATDAQFHAAYPRAKDLFALKARLDPDFRLRNVIWDTYYAPKPAQEPAPAASEFKSVYATTEGRDRFYLFLQNIFNLYPEDRFHTLIEATSKAQDTDEDIYRALQDQLPGIKPALADLTHALPALKVQKQEMARQTAKLLADKAKIDGYVEIGTTGRYVKALKKSLKLTGPITLLHDKAPTNSPVDIVERGQIGKLGRFVDIRDYAPISEADIATASCDLVTCYIGLHHAAPEKLEPFLKSVARILRPGGTFILRDHDVPDETMNRFVCLVHTVFNLGTGESWDTNAAEPRYFNALGHWAAALERCGFRDSGARLTQANDPSANTLMAFSRI